MSIKFIDEVKQNLKSFGDLEFKVSFSDVSSDCKAVTHAIGKMNAISHAAQIKNEELSKLLDKNSGRGL